jgi:cobalt-precorrin 5A hydrolase/precorrin-3B C17-methyltransferase
MRSSDLIDLGIPFGWRRGSGDWVGVSAALDRRDAIQIIQEAGSTRWQSLLPADSPVYIGFPDYTATTRETTPEPKARIWISPIQRRFAPESAFPKVQWHPRVLWVGVGCQRGTSESLIEHAIQKTLRSHHLAEVAIAGIATIDHKADEAGLVKFCGDRLPLRFFSAEDLNAVTVRQLSLKNWGRLALQKLPQFWQLGLINRLIRSKIRFGLPKKSFESKDSPDL